MKKVLYLAAMLSLVLVGFSCTKPGGNRADGNQNGNENTPPKEEAPKVTVCEDNLVIYLPFENDQLIEKGEGITFKENKGDVQIKTGYIGKGWFNKSGDNKTTAYSKFDVAADNAFKKIEKVTMTAWVFPSAEKAKIKGGLFSLNGGRLSTGDPHDFPAMNVYFDNYGVAKNEETGAEIPWQQINGRFILHDNKGVEQNLWLDSGLNGFDYYGKWFQLAVTYDRDRKVKDEESGNEVAKDQVNIYINGELVAARTFEHNIPFNNLVTEFSKAFYVGGWSSFIEGDSVQDFQNYWAGGIDEIRIYNKALSEEEVLALYKEEVAVNLYQED